MTPFGKANKPQEPNPINIIDTARDRQEQIQQLGIGATQSRRSQELRSIPDNSYVEITDFPETYRNILMVYCNQSGALLRGQYRSGRHEEWKTIPSGYAVSASVIGSYLAPGPVEVALELESHRRAGRLTQPTQGTKFLAPALEQPQAPKSFSNGQPELDLALPAQAQSSFKPRVVIRPQVIARAVEHVQDVIIKPSQGNPQVVVRKVIIKKPLIPANLSQGISPGAPIKVIKVVQAIKPAPKPVTSFGVKK